MRIWGSRLGGDVVQEGKIGNGGRVRAGAGVHYAAALIVKRG
jgi:hypothetical protein